MGKHVEVLGHDLQVTLLLGSLVNGHLWGYTALGRVIHLPTTENPVKFTYGSNLVQGPDHLVSDALAFLVSVGDREASTKKLDSFCVTSGA